MINLVKDTISNLDVNTLIEWLKEYPRLTKGPKTIEFEEAYSDYLGCKKSTFVNSGSSAILLMLQTLIEKGDLAPGDKVVVPAVSWATDLAPVMQLGLVPVLCDCNLDDFSYDIDDFKSIALTKPKAAILVSVLGLVPDMDAIMEVCNDHDIILLEDVCESMGSEYKGKKLGTFGKMSVFSTYFGHHISTIEGGLVCTSDDECDDLLKSVRSHGWARDLSREKQQDLSNQWAVRDFDALFTFYNCGFNLRATDLQAFIGIGQVMKLPWVVKKRNENFLKYQERLGRVQVKDHSFVSNFAYPILTSQRDHLVAKLMEGGVEVRPLICGSMGHQPFYMKKYGRESLPNADKVHSKGLYLPNHPFMSDEDIRYICDLVHKYDN